MKYLIAKYPDGYEEWTKEYNLTQDDDIAASMARVSMADQPAVAAVSSNAAHGQS
jgi:hypothetical protein